MLAAVLAAAPARGDDTVGMVPSATTGDSPVPTPVDTTAQSNTATNTQTATATGGAGGTATGGDAGPSQVAGGGSDGGDAYANGGSAQSHNSLQNGQSNQTSGRNGAGHSGSGMSRGVDDALDEISATKPRESRPAPHRSRHTRSPAGSGSGAANDASRAAAKESSGHETGKASSGGETSRNGSLAPDQKENPFLSLLNAPGGAGASLTLLLLAVLGAAIALPRERHRVFRPPTVPWRPLAYVPPIELPG